MTGPRRSGRTLLARSFVERVGGRLFDEADRRDEEELFHAWNQAQDTGRPLVMVADEVPPAWAPRLPDLKTRLAITPVTRINHPDDALFAALAERTGSALVHRIGNVAVLYRPRPDLKRILIPD